MATIKQINKQRKMLPEHLGILRCLFFELGAGGLSRDRRKARRGPKHKWLTFCRGM